MSAERFTERIVIRQVLEYDFQFTLPETLSAEYREWLGDNESSPVSMGEFLTAGHAPIEPCAINAALAWSPTSEEWDVIS